jgi:long-chain acyl-CoA synthetase
MQQIGLHKGDRIILSAHKDIEYIYLYFASHILGVVNVIVDAESNEERLQYIEKKVVPAFCFGYTSSSTKSFLFDELKLGNVEPLVEFKDNISTDDIAEILFTTGTTGAPKGVCLSYSEIYSSASNINEYIGNKSDDVELLGLPICHSFGLGRIRCALIKGATIVILPSFANVRQYLKAIEQYNITGFGVVPAAWAYIRKMSGTRIAKYANQIRYIEIGSAAMPLETKKEMLEMFPNTRICMHYGLTEASRNCFIEFHDVEYLASIGKPVCDKVDVRIFGKDGEIMRVNEPGELCVKGNMVLSRYLDDFDNQNAFYGDYFRTGDCGYMDADGYLYLIGREKELINVGGKKVSPMEVEDAIMSLGVGDCVCVPIKDTQGIIGEQVFCYVLKGSTTLSFEEISQKLSAILEFYKRPVAYDWIDEIPMTASGKKQRLQVTK